MIKQQKNVRFLTLFQENKSSYEPFIRIKPNVAVRRQILLSTRFSFARFYILCTRAPDKLRSR